jgi:hypothetical protein
MFLKKSSGLADIIKINGAKIVILRVKFKLLFGILFCALAISAQHPWTYVGPGEMPQQVKGMVKALWCDEKDPNYVLAGSACGGLFECKNAQAAIPQWKCITDQVDQNSYGISDIIVMPNTNGKEIYVATCSRSGLSESYGEGIMRTLNGGISWEHVGPGDANSVTNSIDGLIANKQDPNEMIAYYSRKIYLTKDAWKTFERVNAPIDTMDTDVSIADVEFAPFEPGKFYVGTRTNNKYTAKLFVFENLPAGKAGFGKSVTDITPEGKSERVEITVLNNEKYKGKFYVAFGWVECYIKYFDGKKLGANLNAAPVTHFYGGAYWNFELSVNEKDTSVMYLSLTETSRSIDGGRTFQKLSSYNQQNAHADNRAQLLVRSTAKGKDDLLLVGNDGGVSLISSFEPPEWKNLNGKGLDIGQFWGISVLQSDSLLVAGGTADNGGFILRGKETINTLLSCGDGFATAVYDKDGVVIECNTPSIWYHNLKYGSAVSIQVADPRFDGKRPILVRDSFLYVGYSNVWRTTFNELKKGNGVMKKFSDIPDEKTAAGAIRNHVLKGMAFSEYNTGIISYRDPNWGNKDNIGKVYFCGNTLKNKWKDITKLLCYGKFEICQWSEVNTLAFDPDDPEKIYFVSKDVYHASNNRLFEMEIFSGADSAAIREIGIGLPKIGINDIVIDKFSKVMYLACDNGIYFSEIQTDTMRWKKMNDAEKFMPNTLVFDAEINYATNEIFAGTMARGIWRAQLINAKGMSLNYGKSKTIETAFKVDGIFSLGKKAILEFKDKFIITRGSQVILTKGSQLTVRKSWVRNENNEITDLKNFLKIEKGAHFILKD